jgi:ubiquinone biosynthesis protein UbiJ
VAHKNNMQLLHALTALQRDSGDIRKILRHQRNDIGQLQLTVDHLSTHWAEETSQHCAAVDGVWSQLTGAALVVEELDKQLKQQLQQRQRAAAGSSSGQPGGVVPEGQLQQMQDAIMQLQEQVQALEQRPAPAASEAPATADAAAAVEGPLAALAERLDRVEGVAAGAATGRVTDQWRDEMQRSSTRATRSGQSG